MSHGLRTSSDRRGNRFSLLRNRLQHISRTRYLRQINFGFDFFFAANRAGAGFAGRRGTFRGGADVHTYLFRFVLLQRTGMRLLLGHPDQR
jgi:hypothetical protein